MLELLASSAVGAITGILITMAVEWLRRPRLALSIEADVRDRPQQPDKPARVGRVVRLEVTNKPGPRWMTRDPALRCQATITFRHLDGQAVFAKSMEGRWGTSPEPIPLEISGAFDEGLGRRPIKLYMRDPTRITPFSRIDIHAGESQPLDVAARFDDDQECYGWNNWSFWSNPLWRNPEWRLQHARYLVEVTVTSSGQTCWGLYRLINDVPRSHFRLEEATPEDRAKIPSR